MICFMKIPSWAEYIEAFICYQKLIIDGVMVISIVRDNVVVFSGDIKILCFVILFDIGINLIFGC